MATGLVLAGERRFDPRGRDWLVRVCAVAWPHAVSLAGATGGLRSPAAVACALCALGLTSGFSVRRIAAASVVTVLGLAGAQYAAQHALPLGDLTSGAALVGALTVVPAWQARRLARSTERARRRDAGLRAPADGESAGEADRRRSAERDEFARESHAVASYLAQVRDHVGAEEVIFWRFIGSGDGLVPAAWSTHTGAPPTRFDADQWSTLVTWSAQERIVHCAGSGATPVVAVAPAVDDRQCVGALSVSADKGLAGSREALKEWLPRYAAHAALVGQLIRERSDVAQHSHRTAVLLHAAQEFQANRSAEALGQCICETALRMTPAARAALVRWNSERGRGELQSASPGHSVHPGVEVEELSHVGAACRNGLPAVWEDARQLDESVPLYAQGAKTRAPGSLAIVPLKHGAQVIGAIVLEGDAPGDVFIGDARHVRLLGALAAVSLAAVWEMEEVAERARTDQLTGLSNRRHFEEHLARMLNEADRFGGPVSLVVADIDFFKRVNDTHGHDGGDAVLRAVAATMRERARSVDVCARYGGEEIALLLPQTPLTGAYEVAERLRRAIASKRLRVGGAEITVTASFGVATYPDSALTRDAFFPAADRALYRAKADGRNCVKCAPVIRSTKAT